LVQACVFEPTFNPFYPLVAAKISNLMPKFKPKLQYTLWDHLKLLESYNARKISNLAKFEARFIANLLSNGSLSVLKYFSDLVNVTPN
jgi:nucleolar MIF4G domain-containing protein 1